MDLELTQIHEYKVFKDTGKAQFHNGKVVTSDGFQKIRVHFVYAVKHDGRFKARVVADGHLTKEPVESIYSGVVSLRSLRMVVSLVVTSSTIPNSTISKRHHLASYHRVREVIAAKYISFHWKDGKSSPADILSKHWEFATVWPMLKPILFWRGETATQLKGSDRIPSTNPGAEPPRDARDSGSARLHSTHLETSSSYRP